MLTPGHLASSYIISQIPSFYGKSLTTTDQMFVIALGYVLDLDLFIPSKKGAANHHLLPTHTLLFACLLLGILITVFIKLFSSLAFIFGGVALFAHLVLDDLSFWLYKLGFKKECSVPQIFWLYPFDKQRKKVIDEAQNITIMEALRLYFTHPITVFLEIALVLLAVAIFVFQC